MRKLLVLMLVCLAGQAEGLKDIPARMKRFTDRGAVSGAVTLVQHKGKVLSLEAVGLQNIDAKTAMKTDTIFQIMSMTKPVTCVAVMILAEEGRLSLTDAVEKHLPEFRGMWVADGGDGQKERKLVRPARAITIRDLMTHTSGMQEMPPEGMGGVRFYYGMNRPLGEAVSIYSQIPLLFQPGTKWQYSNTGLATLGRIVEVVSDQPYEKFLEQRIFQPLGMKDSFLFPPADKQARIAMVYAAQEGKLVAQGDLIYRKGAKYSMPEGGMYSTASDMAAFYQMMLNGGALNGNRVLSRASVEVMTANHTADVLKGGSAFGLGWSVVQGPTGTLTLRSKGSYGHGGAFGTLGWVDAPRQLVGVFMIQVLGGGAHDAMREAFVTMANAAVSE
jgi:CubicO group peptidase (beta-lactamase class C family)